MSALARIGETYYFRLRVPKDLRQYFPRAEIVKSTHAKKYQQAKGLVRGLLGKTEDQFMVIRSKSLDDVAVSKIVREFVETTLEGKTMIAVNTGASVNGRLLAQTAVTLQMNAITEPAR